MFPRRIPAGFALLPLLAALILPACSSSPKSSGKKKSVLLSTTYDDARVGRESSEEIAKQMGLLEDPELEAYVSGIGRKLLRGMPRRSFQYEFHVVDQFEPNAFALPGGYIFVSRGLLALVNSEDELANVIGHEITHAARRHAAAQQEISRRNPLSMGYLRAASISAYGRDMERDADRGGQMLAAAAGYDPMGMASFLESLANVQRLLVGYTRRPTFFDTHPGSDERAATCAARAREIRWKRDPALGDTRASHLRRIDGIALGDRPEGGVFQGSRFLHPDLDFQIRFPHGWQTQNTNQAVGAIAPDGGAVVFLTADLPAGEPRLVAQGFVEKVRAEQPVEVKDSRPVKIGRIDAWRMELEGSGMGGSLSATVTFIPHRGSTWRVMGVAPSRLAGKYLGRVLNTARSFRPLTDEERRSIRAMRLRLATARSGETLTALSERTDNAWDPNRTAVDNGIFSNHRFEGGELVKIARVEPYVPAR